MILDEQITTFKQTGDFNIGKDIFDQSYRLAEQIIIDKYYNFGYVEDLRSESHDAIVAAIYAFKPEKKTKFLTFCYTCINNKILNFIKRKNVASKYTVTAKPKHFSSINHCDVVSSLQDLSPNHLNCLLSGQGSRSMKFRAKQKLLEKID